MADQEKNKQLLSGLVAWGCDVPGALVRFLNNEDFYCTLLHSVPEEKGFVELGVALKKKDTNAAFDSAHELKGVLANMGLTPLWEDACALVEPLRVGKMTGTEENYAKLLTDLSTLKEMLK
jgi:hypothetical protein